LKKQPVKNLASLNRPQGNGLASNSQSHSGAEKARAYVFLLLKFRLRSENELRARLKQKGFSEELAADTVSFLKDKEFIDDRVFAKGWVSSRLKRPLGLRKIKQELLQKGIAKEIIQDALAQASQQYSESQVVSQLAKQRFSRLKSIEPLKAKARVYGYLMRRGFSPDVVSDIINNLDFTTNFKH
jgi:regulatory protein